ncbi:33913_t:CDS:2 [Racocetra persica]|uniref:33913_t:CDS:1 n=1 Tax=Racocetra persica TaxID=160502 RepID=A0ACA9KR76_9GLOM|nr:33913_t:CDS:2 [Racocetra persica]
MENGDMNEKVFQEFRTLARLYKEIVDAVKKENPYWLTSYKWKKSKSQQSSDDKKTRKSYLKKRINYDNIENLDGEYQVGDCYEEGIKEVKMAEDLKYDGDAEEDTSSNKANDDDTDSSIKPNAKKNVTTENQSMIH